MNEGGKMEPMEPKNENCTTCKYLRIKDYVCGYCICNDNNKTIVKPYDWCDKYESKN